MPPAGWRSRRLIIAAPLGSPTFQRLGRSSRTRLLLYRHRRAASFHYALARGDAHEPAIAMIRDHLPAMVPRLPHRGMPRVLEPRQYLPRVSLAEHFSIAAGRFE